MISWIMSQISRKPHEVKRPIEELCEEQRRYDALLSSNWQHRKGGEYRIEQIAFRERTLSLEVVYRDVASGVVYIRPLDEFMDGRFRKI